MKSQTKAELLLLSVTFIWGSTFVITKSLIEEASPFIYTGIRFSLAAALLFLVYPKRLRTFSKPALKRGAVLGSLVFAGFVLQTIGLQFTTASKSAFFTGMLVVLTPIIHYVVQHFYKLMRKPLRAGNIVGVVFAALGLYFLTSPEGSSFNIGDAMTLVCALLFAIYIVYLDFATDVEDKMQLTLVQFLVCGIAGMIGAFSVETIHLHWTNGFIASLLYLTIFATVIAMAVQIRFQGDTTPTRAALIFALEPVIAGVMAFYVRGEILGTLGVIGGGIIMCGVLISEFSEQLPLLTREF